MSDFRAAKNKKSPPRSRKALAGTGNLSCGATLLESAKSRRPLNVYFIHSFCNGNSRLSYSRSRIFASPSKVHSQVLSRRILNTGGSLWGIGRCYFSFSSVYHSILQKMIDVNTFFEKMFKIYTNLYVIMVQITLKGDAYLEKMQYL